MKISRRDLLLGIGATPLVVRTLGAQRPTARPKLAAICTSYFRYSHSQHIVDRFLEGYGWNGTFHHPEMDLVSIYLDQVPNNDVSRTRFTEFPAMKRYPTIAEALTLGGSKLAIDGVVLVGEHGTYPRNEKRQTMYPRYEFFKQIVQVYKDSGRSVPLFNDKHLSWNWAWAKEMYDTSRSMGFPMMAGSSLAVTWRTPSVEMPLGSKIREALCVCYGGVDSYDFHGLETLQCMVERRQNGETGVKWLQAYRGDAFWKAHEDRVWPADLFEAALSRSHTLKSGPQGLSGTMPSVSDMRTLVSDPVAYRYQHQDGLTCTMLLMSGLVEDFNFAAHVEGHRGIFSTQMYLPMPPARTSLASFFSPLSYNFEQMFLTGKETIPLERNLLTTGLTSAGVDSLFQQQARLDTPHLAIRYQAPKASTFWRA
jgi:hypothetical protein